jgi:hypothetical protein
MIYVRFWFRASPTPYIPTGALTHTFTDTESMLFLPHHYHFGSFLIHANICLCKLQIPTNYKSMLIYVYVNYKFQIRR